MIVQTEQIVETDELGFPGSLRYQPFERSVVSAVVEQKFGAHPTGGGFDYGIDLSHLKTYAASAEPGAWADYSAKFVEVDPQAYLAAVGGAERVASLAQPVY